MQSDNPIELRKRAEPFTGIGRLFRYVSAAQPPMQFAISCQTTSHQSQQQGRRKCPARFSFRIPSPYRNPLLSHPHTNRPNTQHHPVNHKRENQRLYNLSERIRPFERRQGVENPGRDKPGIRYCNNGITSFTRSSMIGRSLNQKNTPPKTAMPARNEPAFKA